MKTIVCQFVIAGVAWLPIGTGAMARPVPHDPDENINKYGRMHHHAELNELADMASEDHIGKADFEAKKIFTIDQLVRMLRQQNFDIRANAERVYQAKKNIDVKVGALLPSLSFGTLMSLAEPNPFELVPSLLGFLFPSNWFRWKESKLFFEAERWSQVTLIANQVNSLMIQICRVLYIRELIGVYEQYTRQMRSLARNSELRFRMGEGRFDAKADHENIVLQLEQDTQALRNGYVKLKYEIAFSVDLDVEEWNRFDIEPVGLPDLDCRHYLAPEDLLADIIEISPERKQLKYLVEAAKYSRRARTFDFLNPNGSTGNSLGYGYISQIKIGRSRTEVLNTKTNELKSRLQLAAYRVARDQNLALDNYRQFKIGLKNSEKVAWFLNDNLTDGGGLEPANIVSSVQALLCFHSKLLQTRHNYLVSQEVMNRLLLQSDHYKGIKAQVFERSESRRQGDSSWSLTRRLENWKIYRAGKNCAAI